ncbi:hypothetical protein RRF57_002166 [Xylaria bambusicola]|uniref:UvrD-like helicase C-terminal domain-containing protein n=1 Tax=Xylaria bambusicola TaxID=326684 RepID=A0AAN7Z6Q1_9PEZI
MRIIHQPDNNDAFARIINVPKRGIGEVTIKALLEEAEKSSMSLWQLIDKHCRGQRRAKTNIRQQTENALSGSLLKPLNSLRERVRPEAGLGTPLNLVELIQKLVRDLKFEDYLEATYGAEYESRWANVQEFITLVEEFMRQSQANDDDDALPTIEGFAQASEDDILAKFLSNISLASDKQTDDKDQEGKPLVTISTIHAAKGLEWPVVFIPAVYNGSIPHSRAEDQNEERRLLYVAMTRAKALLYLSCPQTIASGGGKPVELSSFIGLLPSSAFLSKGPSFDRPVMSSVAKILSRELPLDSVIYKGIPSMAAPEDNLFPVDPSQPLSSSVVSGGDSHGGWARKRQKLHHPAKSVQVAEESVEGWAAPYKTTMQKAASFTVPHSTDFTTAGAHMVSVAAAAEASRSAAPPPLSAKSVPRKTTSNRPPNQRSLLGYGYGIMNHDKSKKVIDVATNASIPPKRTLLVPAPPPPYARRRTLNEYRLPPSVAPSINPTLASHKLGAAKLPASKPPPRRNEPSSKQYPNFSSSPTRPSTESSSTPVPIVPTTRDKDIDKNTGKNPSEVIDENISPDEYRRPAANFHATTVSGPLGWRAGIKRPAGLGRSGITPMEKLNKPYKLTIKRS